MINIALFGPPGAGKGTQSQWLVSHFELIHIAPGDILRENIEQETPLGKRVQSYINNGLLVPNQVVIEAITQKIVTHTDANGFLFDGYPRTQVQAEALDEQLANQQRILDIVLFLQVPEEESYQRIKKRRKREHRVDDQSDEKIATRFDQYYHTTLPVSEYYAKQEKLIHIPGVSSIQRVREAIHQEVQEYLYRKS